eukprot:5674807-Karenia_brevis.AAC.1
MGYVDPEKERGEGRAQTQVRIQRLYIEIQEELFGPDFRTQAVRASPAAELEQPPTPGEGVEPAHAGVEEFAISTPPPIGQRAQPMALMDVEASPD